MEQAFEAAAVDATPNEWRGAYCAESRPSARVVDSKASWDGLWQTALKQEPPAVDFSRHFALAVFLGSMPTGGYAVEFLEPLSDGRELLLRYRALGPRPGGFVTQAFTQPYAIKLYRRSRLKVTIAEAKG